MLSRRQLGGLLLACNTWTERAAAAQRRTTWLFIIARSTNANVVRYVARTNAGELDPKQPIGAYWQMLAEDGRREELSFAERSLAYGFTVSMLSDARCRVQLVAFKQRPLSVERGPQGFRAVVTIAGVPAVLNRIFVKVNDSGLVPTVEYLDISGMSLSGSPLTERIGAR